MKKKHLDNVKTINEFLIDLVGVLVPGVIFLFSIVISSIIPAIILCFEKTRDDSTNYATKTELLMSNIFQGWFWMVLFFAFLILAYALGNIFYRLDIKDVDRESFIAEKVKIFEEKIKSKIRLVKFKKNVSGNVFNEIDENKIKEFKNDYLELLYYHLSEEDRIILDKNKDGKDEWKKMINKKSNPDNVENNDSNAKIFAVTDIDFETLNAIAFLLYNKKNTSFISDGIFNVQLLDLNINEKMDKEKTIIFEFLNTFLNEPEDDNKLTEYFALGWFFIFTLRSEAACDNKISCQFPYEYYNTYLLKRGEDSLVKFAGWCKDKDSRTKNAINNLKLEIQFRAKNNYSILVKNEAHVRMSSSSYQVAENTEKIAFYSIIVIVLIFIVYILISICSFDSLTSTLKCSIILVKAFIILGMPLSIIFLSRFIKNSVIKFLHYQRLREIFFVLKVYAEMKELEEKAEKKGSKLVIR